MHATALGIFETKGSAASFAALDTMLNTAPLSAVSRRILTGGQTLLLFEGSPAAVQLALHAGTESVRRSGSTGGGVCISDPDSKLRGILSGQDATVARGGFNAGNALACLEVDTIRTAGVVLNDLLHMKITPYLRLEHAVEGRMTILASGDLDILQERLVSIRDRYPSVELVHIAAMPHPDLVGIFLRPVHAASHHGIDTAAGDIELRAGPDEIPALPPRESTKKSSPAIRPTGLDTESSDAGGYASGIRRRHGREHAVFSRVPAGEDEKMQLLQDYAEMPVWRLRQVARSLPDMRIFGREISRANRRQLLDEITRLFTASGPTGDRMQDTVE